MKAVSVKKKAVSTLTAFLFTLSFLIPSVLRADDLVRMKRILAYHVANGQDDNARRLSKKLLQSKIAKLRFSINNDSFWIIAGPDGALVDGKAYDLDLGQQVKIRLTQKGSWVVAGSDGAISDGQVVEAKQTATILHNDLLKGRATRIGGARALSSSYNKPQTLAYDPSLKNTTLAFNEGSSELRIIKDTIPPTVTRIQLIRFPDDPSKKQTYDLPASNLFVGAENLELVVTMSEAMGSAPRLQLTQNASNAVQAGLVAGSSGERIFRYRFFPNTSPQANGPVKIEVMGKKDGNPPEYGYDLAGNPIAPGSFLSLLERATSVDTIAPDLRRVDTTIPGNIQSIPADGRILAGHAFPSSIVVYVSDYDQLDDGTFSAPNLSTVQASGVDFENIGGTDSTIDLRLFTPDGRQINGTLVVRMPALELLLPDVYDPTLGIFPDTDGDGRADPIEGNYRIEVDIVDRAGNTSTHRLSPNVDGTPLPDRALALNINPVFSTPFPNPTNPIGLTGTCVKRLESVEITSSDPDWNVPRSTVRLLNYVAGPNTVPVEMKVSIDKSENRIMLTVLKDQDGDGKVDFENPSPGAYLPPGMIDPRWGKNDGLYIIEVSASDNAGNLSKISRQITIDTTPPKVQQTFPSADTVIGPPLRLVDAIVVDPAPTSGSKESGISYEHFFINLKFEGNDETEAQQVKGIGFIHQPNDSDPTQSNYNPNDHYPKLLYEFVNAQGQVISLPDDGSWDGIYQMTLTLWDKAGNEVKGSAAFTFSSTASTIPTTGPNLRITLVH